MISFVTIGRKSLLNLNLSELIEISDVYSRKRDLRLNDSPKKLKFCLKLYLQWPIRFLRHLHTNPFIMLQLHNLKKLLCTETTLFQVLLVDYNLLEPLSDISREVKKK